MPTYDYVIVGAGSAGCVLAARLTEDPAVKVLLVEAGPPDTSDLIHIPAAFSALFRTQQDWDHMTGWEPGSTAAASTCRAGGRSAGRRR
jgi:choline dehydrogenase